MECLAKRRTMGPTAAASLHDDVVITNELVMDLLFAMRWERQRFSGGRKDVVLDATPMGVTAKQKNNHVVNFVGDGGFRCRAGGKEVA